MEFSNATLLEILKNQSIDNSLQESIRELGLLELKAKLKRNCVKNRIRRFIQVCFKDSKESTMLLDTMISVKQSKFKNKIIVEVSDPQTDYKFYKKI
jgi:hypothetical protein